MSVNNEIGTIQPIYEISRIAKMYNIIFHTDSVQACGHIPIDVRKMGIDMLSLSGHKLYAPKGVGVLYIKSGINIENLIEGGHQERNMRAGTENVAGIVGLGKACEIAGNNLSKNTIYLQNLRDYFIKLIKEKEKDAILNGSIESRVASNANFSFKGIDAENLLLKLDAKGICASSGSACSSGDSKPSHVLKAIGLSDELAKGALRITFGEENTKEDVEYLVECIMEGIRELR